MCYPNNGKADSPKPFLLCGLCKTRARQKKRLSCICLQHGGARRCLFDWHLSGHIAKSPPDSTPLLLFFLYRSQAQLGKGSGGSLDYGNPIRTHAKEAPATHNERHREKQPGRNDEVPATHKTSAAANNGLSTTAIPPCSAASFEEELRAPHRGSSLGPFVCGARACSLCSLPPRHGLVDFQGARATGGAHAKAEAGPLGSRRNQRRLGIGPRCTRNAGMSESARGALALERRMEADPEAYALWSACMCK